MKREGQICSWSNSTKGTGVTPEINLNQCLQCRPVVLHFLAAIKNYVKYPGLQRTAFSSLATWNPFNKGVMGRVMNTIILFRDWGDIGKSWSEQLG